MNGDKQQKAAQGDEKTPHKTTRLTADFLPIVVNAAPGDFLAHGASLENLRVAYGVKPKRALELVLAGLAMAMYRKPPASEKQVIPIRRRNAA